MAALLFVILILLPVVTIAEPGSAPAIDHSAVQAQATRTAPLTIDEVLARIELTHPLLRAVGVERMQARAKILKALGAWERWAITTASSMSGIPGASRSLAGSATASGIASFTIFPASSRMSTSSMNSSK